MRPNEFTINKDAEKDWEKIYWESGDTEDEILVLEAPYVR